MATLISDVIRERAERGIADLLLSAYDAGYCAGAGIALASPALPGMAALLTTIMQRHADEILALRGWADPPVRADDLPAWLLSLPSQADARAAAARVIAQENERPHDWIRSAGKEGKP